MAHNCNILKGGEEMSMSRCKSAEITKEYVILHYGNGRTEVVKIADAMKTIPAEHYADKFDLSNRVAEVARSLVGKTNLEEFYLERDAFLILVESCKSYDGMCDLARKWGVID